MTNHPLSFLANSALKTRSQVKNAKQTDHGVETMPPKGLTEQKGSQNSSEEGHSNDKARDSHFLALAKEG